MSQASNKVAWCLNKAKRELDECKQKDLRPQHRGLLKSALNRQKAEKHIQKAEHNLHAMLYLLKGDFEDISVNLVFYSMYHCMLAISVKFGYESRNQTCTLSLIEFLREEGKIDIDDSFIKMMKYAKIGSEEENIIDLRETYTYGIDISVTNKDKLNRMVEDCRRLIDITRDIILNE